MLEWLTGIAKIDAKSLQRSFFATGSLLRSKTEPSVIIQADRKTFTEYGHKISISQIEEIGMFGLEDVQEGLVRELRKLVEKRGAEACCLLVTDIVTHDSMLLESGMKKLWKIEYERPWPLILFST